MKKNTKQYKDLMSLLDKEFKKIYDTMPPYVVIPKGKTAKEKELAKLMTELIDLTYKSMIYKWLSKPIKRL